MNPDLTFEELRRANPVRSPLTPPALDLVLARVQEDPAGTRSGSRGGRAVRHLGRLGTAAALGVCLGVVAVVLVLALAVHSHAGRPSRTAAAPVPRVARALVDELGILRHPQTAADRTVGGARIFDRAAFWHRVRVLGQLTHLAVLPGGVKLYLFVTVPRAGGARHARLTTIAAYPYGGSIREGDGPTAAALRIPSGPIPGAELRGETRETYYEVVPDGVTRVRWQFPRQAFAPSPGIASQTFAKPLTVSVPVHDNIAAARLPKRGFSPAVTTWFDAAGAVIARHGNPHLLDRVLPTPKAAPPTALSRRAQRNPATPNPITASPRTGRAHTVFTLGFTVLISRVAYHVTVTGGPHSGCAPDYGHDDYSGDYLRGQRFTLALVPPRDGWCAGTYTITAAVVRRVGTPAFAPFGHTTIRVR